MQDELIDGKTAAAAAALSLAGVGLALRKKRGAFVNLRVAADRFIAKSRCARDAEVFFAQRRAIKHSRRPTVKRTR